MLANGLGALIMVPLCLALARAEGAKAITAPAWEVVLTGLGVTFSAAAALFNPNFPLLFFVWPFIMIATFRLGSAGAAIAC